MIDLYLSNSISQEDYTSKLNEFEAIESSLEEKLTETKRLSTPFKHLKKIFTVSQNVSEIFPELANSQKRQILGIVFKNIHLKGKKLVFEGIYLFKYVRKFEFIKDGAPPCTDLQQLFNHPEWSETVSKLEVFLEENQDVSDLFGF